MLALAPRHERVDYIRHDINTLPVPEILQQVRFDCFAIGRAIHWIDEGALAQVTEQNLKREGCILICGSGFSDKTKWIAAFRNLKEAYSHDEGEKDHKGNRKLGRIGFQFQKEMYAMALYLVDGKLQGAVISWMTIYRR